MGLHTGPKNGDYARYVEFLTSGTGGEPGKVYTSRRAKPANWSLESEAPPLPDGFIADAGTMKPNPLVPPGRSHQQPTMEAAADRVSEGYRRRVPSDGVQSPTYGTQPSPGQSAQRPFTLAEQARRRALGSIFLIVALFVALSGLSTLFFVGVMAPGQDPDAFIPGIFLLIFAWMLFRGARGLRRDADRPTQALPPLTTLSNRPAPK